MRKPTAVLLLAAMSGFAAQSVLIVADEFPAMEVLAGKLKAAEGIESRIVKQAEMPKDLAPYGVVIVYIHGDIREQAERAFIGYTQAGGKLVLLHHSISSGKRKNQLWVPFTGVNLPYGEWADGGYKWIDPVTMDIVNLAPEHYITSHNVKWPAKTEYNGKPAASFTLTATEVYLNHVFTGPRTILLGLKYKDATSGKVFTQDTAGWYMRSGQGWVYYFMPGHSVTEFQDPVYGQMVANAVAFKP